MKVEIEKIVPVARRRNLIRDRSIVMDRKFIPIAENIKHVYLDKISEAIRVIAQKHDDDDLNNIADILDLYQAAIFLRIKEFVPCQTCCYYNTLLEQTMVKSIEDIDGLLAGGDAEA